MKKISLCILSVALLPASVFANELPNIKAGLWEIENVLDGKSEGKTIQCMDSNTTKDIMSTGSKMLGNKCKEVKTKKQGAKYVSNLECNIGSSLMKSSSVMSGDFTTSFTVKADTTFTPPFMGQSSSSSTSNAKYLGACKDGMVAGDAILPDGTKINITKSMENMPDLSALESMQKALETGNVQELMNNMQNLEQMQKQMQQMQNGAK